MRRHQILFGGLAMAALICFMFAEIAPAPPTSPSEAIGRRKTTMVGAQLNEVKLGRRKLVYPKLDLNHAIKRRVPNGPDPIHNRRTRNSRPPPGMAPAGKV